MCFIRAAQSQLAVDCWELSRLWSRRLGSPLLSEWSACFCTTDNTLRDQTGRDTNNRQNTFPLNKQQRYVERIGADLGRAEKKQAYWHWPMAKIEEGSEFDNSLINLSWQFVVWPNTGILTNTIGSQILSLSNRPILLQTVGFCVNLLFFLLAFTVRLTYYTRKNN